MIDSFYSSSSHERDETSMKKQNNRQGGKGGKGGGVNHNVDDDHRPPPICKVRPDSIKGSDDAGSFYASHAQLAAVQLQNHDEWYAANDEFWRDGGYGGKTDEEAMIGDEGALEDGEEGLAFLDKMIARTSGHKTIRAIDAGAGVGRVTKDVLLKRYDTVRLVEADSHFSQRSKVYLGRKRSARCSFTCARLEELNEDEVVGWEGPVDLIWLQWTLQYLTDLDAVGTLSNLAKGLVAGTGMLIVKENRPYGVARTDRFQMETPRFNGRYDITRTDAQHRLLFHRAGLRVDAAEEGIETNTYAVSVY
jgi:protein N-terminal methyltransferase